MNMSGLQKFKLRLSPGLYAAYRKSLRVSPIRRTDIKVDGPFIFACLHRDMMPALVCVEPVGPVLLVSRSLDGDILTATLERRGFDFVRGSTGPEGGAAFHGLIQKLRAGKALGLAVDGPRGPFGAIHDGVLQLSRLTRSPIIPLRVEPGGHISLNSWDRTRIPRPFSRVAVTPGEPIVVPRQADAAEFSACADRLKAALLPEEVHHA
jgi:lysophospholipid acyltransferase (LPLAT)-like uncharacterized protein